MSTLFSSAPTTRSVEVKVIRSAVTDAMMKKRVSVALAEFPSICSTSPALNTVLKAVPVVPGRRSSRLPVTEKFTVAAMRSVNRKLTSERSAAASSRRCGPVRVAFRSISSCPSVRPTLPATVKFSDPAMMLASSMAVLVSVTGFNRPPPKP